MEDKQQLWIAFGDIHGQAVGADCVPGLAQARGVILPGDLTAHGGRSEAAMVLGKIQVKNSNILAQIGNMDPPQVATLLSELGMNIHARARALDPEFPGLKIIGVGASTFTPFNTPSEVSDEQIARWLEEALAEAGDYDRLILVAHDPPFGSAVDMLPSGQHVGSKSVRDFIEKVQPELCLCGHIHESRALDTIGRTVVVNPGPFFQNGAHVRITITADNSGAELAECSR